MTKLFECYVANPTHDEAVEIVERLVANGALAYEVVSGMNLNGGESEYDHDKYECWGYNSEFGTFTSRVYLSWAGRSKQLTMQEFRAAFPCDKYDGVIEKRFPSIGTKCESSGGAGMFYVGLSSDGRHVFELDNGGLTMFDTLNGIRPAKSDREKFVESGLEVVKAHQWTAKELLEALYDAGFKALGDA